MPHTVSHKRHDRLLLAEVLHTFWGASQQRDRRGVRNGLGTPPVRVQSTTSSHVRGSSPTSACRARRSRRSAARRAFSMKEACSFPKSRSRGGAGGSRWITKPPDWGKRCIHGSDAASNWARRRGRDDSSGERQALTRASTEGGRISALSLIPRALRSPPPPLSLLTEPQPPPAPPAPLALPPLPPPPLLSALLPPLPPPRRRSRSARSDAAVAADVYGRPKPRHLGPDGERSS